MMGKGKNYIYSRMFIVLAIPVMVFIVLHSCHSNPGKNGEEPLPKLDTTIVKNGIHLPTGLVYESGFRDIMISCVSCHSADLITQNRASREGWKDMITWMQESQGLWDLADREPIILDYLAKHYAPQESGRRPLLDTTQIAWYVLELD